MRTCLPSVPSFPLFSFSLQKGVALLVGGFSAVGVVQQYSITDKLRRELDLFLKFVPLQKKSLPKKSNQEKKKTHNVKRGVSICHWGGWPFRLRKDDSLSRVGKVAECHVCDRRRRLSQKGYIAWAELFRSGPSRGDSRERGLDAAIG